MKKRGEVYERQEYELPHLNLVLKWTQSHKHYNIYIIFMEEGAGTKRKLLPLKKWWEVLCVKIIT